MHICHSFSRAGFISSTETSELTQTIFLLDTPKSLTGRATPSQLRWILVTHLNMPYRSSIFFVKLSIDQLYHTTCECVKKQGLKQNLIANHKMITRWCYWTLSISPNKSTLKDHIIWSHIWSHVHSSRKFHYASDNPR